jgi:NitT/TauT family transport system ATP-binding protein
MTANSSCSMRSTLTYRAGERPGHAGAQGASLAIGKGEFAAIVGPSGCGKSTVLKLVSGLLRANRGRVEVGARAVEGPVKIVGMAFQNPTMLPWLTAIDNVLVPLKIVQPYRSRFKQQRASEGVRGRYSNRLPGSKRHPSSSRWHAAARVALPRADPRTRARSSTSRSARSTRSPGRISGRRSRHFA